MDASCTPRCKVCAYLRTRGALLLRQSLIRAACTRIPDFCRVYWLGKEVRQDPAALVRPTTMEMLLRLTNINLRVWQEAGPGLGSDPCPLLPLLVLHSHIRSARNSPDPSY